MKFAKVIYEQQRFISDGVATRIMVYKGMVYKSKYWIFEKIKGVSVSNCQHF